MAYTIHVILKDSTGTIHRDICVGENIVKAAATAKWLTAWKAADKALDK